ncbi:hypothetical protein KKH23_10095 [Patescibacteria group bacterium]|uniref:Putative helicase n=1 Tax=viral metagenome TaxID=1070528 RepID=A0A6M3M4S1_9ZZZZ|nr:hypothetical protein [Patescibacteria group bacterium]MBU0847523.1 hypothetical protein [Patescibacteria group bacterium]
MAKIQRYSIDNKIEKKIVTGMITNSEFCTSIQKMIKEQYFQIDYARTTVGWIQDYFKHYKKAPGKHIQDIYKGTKDSLNEAEATLIGKFLSELSEAYETKSDFNHEYLLDQTRDYFRERSLSILSEKVQAKLLRGRIDQAELEVKNFNRVVKELGTWFNPFEKSEIYKIFSEENDFMFNLPDELGKLSGNLEREWLIAFMGPMKRGKSFMLEEFAVLGLSSRLKVVIFSLEMSKKEMSKRIHKRITAMSAKSGLVSWPVFDCERNQDNTCKRPERTCSKGVKDPGDSLPVFKETKGYKPCTACLLRDKDNPNEGDYRQAIWKIWKDQKESIDPKIVLKKAKDFERLYGDNFRCKAYPSFTATFDDVISDLDDLWYTEGFVPDIICIDSIDIMAPQGNDNLSERGQIDWAWKRAKGLAGERHCLVATVLQSNRASITQKSVQQDNTSEDIRKLAHVDVMFGLNQTPDEKKIGVMRVSIIAHRHEGFQFGREVKVLQSLEIGQPVLEIQWSVEKEKN